MHALLLLSDFLLTVTGPGITKMSVNTPFELQVFEEDALSWEDKLNRIMALFDVWIDVQRRWVYLEGIFTGSADIKHLLPVETQRFQR